MKARPMLAVAAIAIAAIFALPAGALPPPSPIVNGSFETGDLTGWTATVPVGGSATVVPGGVDGLFTAELKTDGPGSYTTLSQVIPGLGGGFGSVNKLKGWANFVDSEGGSCIFNDNAQVLVDRIVAGFVASTTTVFSASSCSTGSTGWVQWSYSVPGQGAYRIRARIANGGDSVVDSFLYVDAHTYQGLSKVG